MRITNNMLINNMTNYIGNNLQRMDKYQYQLATGKKIQVPSDDPVVAARALKLRTDVSELEQYKKNATDAQSWLDITDETLSQIGDILQRTRELTVQASNSPNAQDDTQKIGEEIKQLRQQLIHLGNSTYSGRYIFSGYKTDTQFIDETTGQFKINVSNNEKIKFELGIGDSIEVNALGGDLFNNGANATAGSTGYLLNIFDNLITDLNSGNTSGIGQAIGNVDNIMNNVLKIRADVGARTNRVDLTSNRLDSDLTTFTGLLSNNEDVDEAETIMNLKNEENVYRASLSGGARIIQPTLLDFLR